MRFTILVLIHLFVPWVLVQVYYYYRPFSKGIINSIILYLLGLILIGILRPLIESFIRSPKVFLIALKELIIEYFAIVISFSLRMINIIRAIFSLGLRGIIWAVALILYVVSPIDIIPDLLFPFGLLDDAGLSIYGFYRLANIVASSELKRKAKEIREKNKRKTKFP